MIFSLIGLVRDLPGLAEAGIACQLGPGGLPARRGDDAEAGIG